MPFNSISPNESEPIERVGSRRSSFSGARCHSRLLLSRRYALYGFFFSLNYEVWDPLNTDGYFSISKLIGYIYLALLIPNIGYFVRVPEGTKGFLWTAWIFFGFLTLISFVHINYMFGAFFDFSIFQCIFIFWFLLNHERLEPFILERAMLWFALGAMVLSILYIMGIGVEYYIGRIRLFGDNSNWIGLRMVIAIIIFCMVVIQNRPRIKKWRYFFLLPLPLLFRLMVETASRVALISFAAAFIAGIVLLKSRSIFVKLLALLLAAVLACYAWMTIMEHEVVANRILETYYEHKLGGRSDIWLYLSPLIKNNWFIGVGETGYNLYAERTFGINIGPHNVILEVLCYTGLVGLLIYLSFQFGIAKRAYESYKMEGVLLPLLLLFPIWGVLLSGQLLYKKIGWGIFAYIISASLFKPEQRQF